MTTFTTKSGMIFTANETMTHCYCWPVGRKGERTRIKKSQFEQAQREEAYFAEQEANEQKLDEAAENPEVTLEQFVEMVQETEESNTTEQIEEIAKEMAPKAKKSRKSKDIAYTGHGVTLTAKQVDFIHHLPDTCFWENGLDSCIWTDVLADEISGQFAGKPMTTGAMISTICEKGLGVRAKDHINGKRCTSFALTGLGKLVAAELGLN